MGSELRRLLVTAALAAVILLTLSNYSILAQLNSADNVRVPIYAYEQSEAQAGSVTIPKLAEQPGLSMWLGWWGACLAHLKPRVPPPATHSPHEVAQSCSSST